MLTTATDITISWFCPGKHLVGVVCPKGKKELLGMHPTQVPQTDPELQTLKEMSSLFIPFILILRLELLFLQAETLQKLG